MSEKYVWYVEPLDPQTNRVIAESLPEENECREMECADGTERNLWSCNHFFVSQLESAKQSLNLHFRVYVQEGHHGKIRRWRFQKRSHRSAVISSMATALRD